MDIEGYSTARLGGRIKSVYVRIVREWQRVISRDSLQGKQTRQGGKGCASAKNVHDHTRWLSVARMARAATVVTFIGGIVSTS
jgi:hypothetical protein